MIFNNRGVSLVVLIVAMTLIAVLGVSFVSLMSSKQKGFLYQIDSYRALNIANAGVEYAVRIVYDNIASPETHITQCPFLTVYDFANGQFKFCYQGDYTSSEFNTLSVEGIYDGGSSTHTPLSARTVKLTHFMNYASNNSITRIPYNEPPVPSSNRLIIPLINSSGLSISITAIRFQTVFSSGERHLQQIYFSNDLNSSPTQTHFFDYTGTLESPLSIPCSVPSPTTQCSDASGIKLGSGEETLIRSNIWPNSYPIIGTISTTSRDLMRWCVIEFSETPLVGTYSIEFLSGTTTLTSLGSITF